MNGNYYSNLPVSTINKVELTKDLNSLNVDIKQLYDCVNFLQLILKKPLFKIGDKEKMIDNIEGFKEITFKISDYVNNKKHKIVSSSEIIQAKNKDKLTMIKAFFSGIKGIFVKQPLKQLENAFWITPHFNESEIDYNQILIALYSKEYEDDLVDYINRDNCNIKRSSIIMIKPSLDVFNDNEVNSLLDKFEDIRRIYYFSRSEINIINNSQDKRKAFKNILIEREDMRK